jgi:hypothetical protein
MFLTEKERKFLDAFLCENQHIVRGPATRKLWALGLSYSDITGLVMAYTREGPKPQLFLEEPSTEVPELPWASKEAALARSDELRRSMEASDVTERG